MKKILFSFIGLSLFSACELSSFQPTLPTSTSTPLVASTLDRSCVSIEPTQDDIDRALSFTGKLFDTPNWERSYSVMEGRVAVTWLHVDGFLAYLEAIIFPLGFENMMNDYANNIFPTLVTCG